MSVAAPAAPAVPKRRFRLKRVLVGALAILVIGAFANLVGWDLSGWFSNLWDTISEISIGYLIAGVTLKTVQTSLTAFGWYAILRFAYADAVRWRDIWACYAASVALNGVLPANIGTLVMLLMFTAIIAGATFAAILGGYAVQKIFFTVIGIFIYLYLFLSVGGSFDIKFAFVHERPWATIVLFGGGAFLLYLLARCVKSAVRFMAWNCGRLIMCCVSLLSGACIERKSERRHSSTRLVTGSTPTAVISSSAT